MSETRERVRCADCGALYADLGCDLVLPDQQWNVISPDANILCANCICHRASKHGGTVVMAWIDNMNYDPAPEGE